MLRVLKSEILTEDRLKDLANAKDLGEVISSLRDSPYSSLSEAKSLDDALRETFKIYIKRVRKISRLAPKEINELVLAFIREEVLRDSISLLVASTYGNVVNIRRLMSYIIEDSPLKLIEQDPESLKNPQRLADLLSTERWLKPYIEMALDLIQKNKGVAISNFITSSSIIDLYSRSLMNSKLSRKELEEVKDSLCPRLRLVSISSVLEASVMEVPPKTLQDTKPKHDLCNTWQRFLMVYEREQEFEALVNNIKRELSYFNLEGSKFNEILENARISALRKLRDLASNSYTGYPLSARLVIAALNLIRLEYESLKIVLSAISLGLRPEEYLPGLVSL